MNLIDFLAELKAGENPPDEIEKIERVGDELCIVLGSMACVSLWTRVQFTGVSSFKPTLFGAPADSEQLPQTLIGFDYWADTDAEEIKHWELNGDECTWNFCAPFPKVSVVDNVAI